MLALMFLFHSHRYKKGIEAFIAKVIFAVKWGDRGNKGCKITPEVPLVVLGNQD